MNEVMRPKPEPGAERHEHAAQGDGERARRVCCDLPRAHLDSGEQEQKEDAVFRGNLEKGARGQTVDQGDRDGHCGEQGDRDAGDDLSHRAGLAEALRQLAEHACHDEQQQQVERMFHRLVSQNSLPWSAGLALRQHLALPRIGSRLSARAPVQYSFWRTAAQTLR